MGTNISVERVASIIKVKRISELGITLAVTSNGSPLLLILFTLVMEATRSSETSVLTRVTQRYVPEDGIIHIAHAISTFHPLFLYTHMLLQIPAQVNLAAQTRVVTHLGTSEPSWRVTAPCNG
jgi:hypothetical protein